MNRLAAFLVRRPVFVLVLALVALVGLAFGLSKIDFRTSEDTLVSPSTQVYRDNLRYQGEFGGETMLVLFSGDPVGLFSGQNIAELQRLESELRATDGVVSVVGPYTAVRYAADQLAAAPGLLTDAIARADDPAAAQARVASEAGRLGAAGDQSLSNPEFVRFLIFSGDGAVRPSQLSAFPDKGHSLIVVRLAGNASIKESARLAQAVKDVVARYHFTDQQLLATGTPVLLGEINSYLQGGMLMLGLVAILVMVVVLALAFRVRLRLLPLAVMALGTAAALGAAGYIGIPLSLVTISGLPIFIGLGVDFAIQMHNRYVEQTGEGDAPDRAANVAVTRMAPPLLVAMTAGAVGFLA
ncbi:MAG TPA: MMPL family transporter, partial [Acidimicrobiales bacterium]|nr:MMPL family transporter [Acidimicrobiales bacterium]